jgi:hypothetical protein
LVLVTFDLLEVLLALSQIFPIIWRPSIKSHLSLHKVASFCTVPLHNGVQHLFDMNPKSFSKRQLCKAPLKKKWKKDNNMSEWNPLSTYFKWIWSSYFRTCWRQYAQS